MIEIAWNTQWAADRIFPICGGFFLVGCLLIAIRMVSQ